MLCVLIIWSDYLDPDTPPITHKNGFCQILPFLTYVFGFLSVYTVVCFTVERFIITFYPLQRLYICTTKRAKVVLSSLTCCACVFYSFPLYMSSVVEFQGQRQCTLLQKYSLPAHILSYTDSVLTLLLPAVLIITLNIAISIKLASVFSEQAGEHLGRRRSSVPLAATTTVVALQTRNGSSCSQTNLTPDSTTSASIFNPNPRASLSNVRVSSSRTTRSLLIISTVFVLLNLPSHALRVYTLFASLNHAKTIHGLHFWQEITQFVYYMNFACNFFLYSLFSRMFRDTLKAIILHKLLRRPQPYYHQVLHLNLR